jgi:hypothetical protein
MQAPAVSSSLTLPCQSHCRRFSSVRLVLELATQWIEVAAFDGCILQTWEPSYFRRVKGGELRRRTLVSLDVVMKDCSDFLVVADTVVHNMLPIDMKFRVEDCRRKSQIKLRKSSQYMPITDTFALHCSCAKAASVIFSQVHAPSCGRLTAATQLRHDSRRLSARVSCSGKAQP